MKARIVSIGDLRKAGPYVGPRGGLWADPQHTIPWREAKGRKGPRTGAISVPEKTVAEAVASLMTRPALSRGIVPSPNSPVVKQWETTVEIEDAAGRHRRRFKVSVAPDPRISNADPRGIHGTYRTAVDPLDIDDRVSEEVVLFVRPGSWDKARLERALRDVLAHELTHAADPAVRKKALQSRDRGDVVVSSKKDRKGYYNQPHEVAASIQQIKRDLTDRNIVAALKQHPSTRPEKLLEQSDRWAWVKEHYSEENKRRVLRAVAAIREAILNDEIEAIDKSLDALIKSGGPYIGPRGGKWADPQHTIPWSDDAGKPKARAVTVKLHPKIVGGAGSEHEVYVSDAGDGMVRVSRHADAARGPTMPRESLKHFVNDLAGKVDVPKSDNPAIEAVRTGRAQLLGKGDDGIAFRVGNQVVKVSTTVPFQPENPGHRSPDEAANLLHAQVTLGNKLAKEGIPVLPSTFVRHGDKGFQIKPYVEIPEKWSRAQLDEIQTAIHAMHSLGYSMNDEIQPGLLDGKIVFYDTGKAAKSKGSGVYSSTERDIDRLRDLYRKSGEKFVNAKEPEGTRAWQKLEDAIADVRAGRTPLMPPAKLLEVAEKKRRRDIETMFEGEERKKELGVLEMLVEFAREDIDALKKSGGPYVGPRGGKWADPQHTIPWNPGERGGRAHTRALVQHLEAKYGVELSVSHGDKHLVLHKIVVPKDKRGGGVGSKVMRDLHAYADAHGKIVALTPSSDFGGTKKRLKEFYSRHGYIENKGKHKDYETRETMYRPQKADLRKGGGPYIGPRGGLWADPQHKIPWDRKAHGDIPTSKCPVCKGVGHIIRRQTSFVPGQKDEVTSGVCRTCNKNGKVKLDPAKVRALGLPLPDAKPKAPVVKPKPKAPEKPAGPDPNQLSLLGGPAPKKPAAAPEKKHEPEPAGKPGSRVVSPHWHSKNRARHGQGKLAFMSKAYALQGELDFQGLDIAIENRAGSKRKWRDPATGEEGTTVMVYPYGYIRGFKGADGDEVDVFVGPDRTSTRVFVVNQRRMNDKRRFDEHKVMLGFTTLADARAAYLKHYDKHGPQLLGSIRVWSMDRFKRWLERGKKTGPVAKAFRIVRLGAR